MITEPLSFTEYPMTFVWFYLYLPIFVGCIVFPILLYKQTGKLPWLLIAFAQFSPLLFLIPALFRASSFQPFYPVKHIDASGHGIVSTATNWPGLIMILAFFWLYLENRKKKIESGPTPPDMRVRSDSGF